MKKYAVPIVIAIIIIVGGGYLIFHKSNNNSNTSNNAPAVNNAVVITKTSSSVGQYLADPKGNALYTYNADSSGVSNCKGACLATWPAYIDNGSTANLPSGITVIKRSDNGKMQYAYNGMPLYYFVSDSKGQVTGNNIQNFVVAKPAAASSSSSSSSSNSTSSGSTGTTNNSSSSSNYNYNY